MPRQASVTQGRPGSSADKVGDLGSPKRARKAPQALQARPQVGNQVSHKTYFLYFIVYQLVVLPF
jgi:hypothetical protein